MFLILPGSILLLPADGWSVATTRMAGPSRRIHRRCTTMLRLPIGPDKIVAIGVLSQIHPENTRLFQHEATTLVE